MKYQVLARKYRPKTFTTMMGQEHVLKALTNALESERLHHAYLFTGTRGVGKTTVARVLAKALNCEQGISASPCGECASCQEIDQGRFVDLIEVDAASRTKVEDTRELLDNVQYAPTRGRFKIYLIDEVHMLSTHSFNALLKTLEEPPPHVKFLLATTDPQKLPVTILSRCLQFNLKSLTIEQIEQQLQLILNAENIPVDSNVLKPLAIAADGSMRDALSLLDQSIAYSDGKPNLADIEAMLGSVQKGRVFELLTALANADGNALIEQSRLLTSQGIDVNTILAEMISMMQRVALCQMVPDAIDESLGDKQSVEQIAQLITPEDIQLYYQIALNGRKDLPYSPQPQGGFEMILLRMLAFKPEIRTKLKPDRINQAAEKKTLKKQTEVKTTRDSSRDSSKHPGVVASAAVRSNQPVSKPTQVVNQIQIKQNHAVQDTEKYHSPGFDDLPPIDAYGQENFNEPAVSELSSELGYEIPALQKSVINEPQEPLAGNKKYFAGNNKYLAENKEPSARNIEPSAENKEPSARNKESSARNIEPSAENKESSTKDIESSTQNKEPSPPSIEPSARNKEPFVEDKRALPETQGSLAEVVPLFKTQLQEKIPCKKETTELAEYWRELINRSELNGLEQQLAKHCALINKTEKNDELFFDLLLESVHKHLLSDKIKMRLITILVELLGCSVRLNIEQCQVSQKEQLDTPRRREIHDAEVLQAQAVESIYADPKVQMIVNAFNAKVRKESIKPVK